MYDPSVSDETAAVIRGFLSEFSKYMMNTDKKVLKIKPLPILAMLGVCIVVAFLIILINKAFKSLPPNNFIDENSSWLLAHLVHIPIFLVPFLLIGFLSKGEFKQFGFNLNQKSPIFTYLRMLVLGAISGVILSLRYIPQLIAQQPIDIPRPVSTASVIGNLTFQWLMVGISEEIMFRGLIQTYLMKNLSGYKKLFGHSFHLGTIASALIWGIFHFINILIMPFDAVVFYVALTTFAGLWMGYAYQQTKSLLTTIIVHNMLFGVPLVLGYFLYWLTN